MSSETKRRTTTTLPQGSVEGADPGKLLLKRIVGAAFAAGVCSKQDFRVLLKKYPETDQLRHLDKVMDFLEGHRSVLWNFLTAKPWWTVKLWEDRDNPELTFMAEILRLAHEAKYLTWRELLRIVRPDRLAAYVVEAPPHQLIALQLAMEKLFSKINENEHVTLNETVQCFDHAFLIRAAGLSAIYSDILVPLAERLHWTAEDIAPIAAPASPPEEAPKEIPTASPETSPEAVTVTQTVLIGQPEEKPSSALLAQGLLQRHASSPLFKAVREVAEGKFPARSISPPESERPEDRDAPVLLMPQKGRAPR